MTWPRWWACAATLLVAVPVTGRATLRLGESPHVRSDRCLSCHIETETGERGLPLPVIATCRSCHPDAEMHPVGMRPEHIPVAAGWPLEDGVVTCATCHAEPGCDASREREAPWLRGGTPARKGDFCFRCHTSQELVRKSPHLAPGETEASLAGCPACHIARPEVGASVADAGLLLPPAEACATCHPGPLHAGAAEHTGAVQAFSLTASAALVLPLAEGGVIGCWTCHDVHTAPQAYAGPNAASKSNALAAALASGPRRDGPEALLALPVGDSSLCRACHGDGP